MTVVADASPLIILAKLDCFDLLKRLFPRLCISSDELSTILLGKELHANAVLLDDYNARKLARAEGLQVRGSLGLLETLYLRGHLTDRRTAFRQLLAQSYIDERLLDLRLRAFGLPPL